MVNLLRSLHDEEHAVGWYCHQEGRLAFIILWTKLADVGVVGLRPVCIIPFSVMLIVLVPRKNLQSCLVALAQRVLIPYFAATRKSLRSSSFNSKSPYPLFWGNTEIPGWWKSLCYTEIWNTNILINSPFNFAQTFTTWCVNVEDRRTPGHIWSQRSSSLQDVEYRYLMPRMNIPMSTPIRSGNKLFECLQGWSFCLVSSKSAHSIPRRRLFEPFVLFNQLKPFPKHINLTVLCPSAHLELTELPAVWRQCSRTRR